MSTATEPLAAGQRLGRAEFHARYEEAPPHLTFELIEGVVHQAGRVDTNHGHRHARIAGWMGYYAMHVPGVEGYNRVSTVLSDTSEVQPDVSLRILPASGGQSHDFEQMIGGAPELVVEVAGSSRRIDLGPKLRAYEAAGVREYIVLTVEPFEVLWHRHRDGQFQRVEPDADGLYRSVSFPGLWLDPTALESGDGPALPAALSLGLATPEHAKFVARLAAAGEQAPGGLA